MNTRIEEAARTLAFVSAKLDTLRFAGLDQNPFGIRDLLGSVALDLGRAIKEREPDPEALIRAIAASIAGGVVWENREDWLDVKDAYRDAIELLDDASLLETAAYLLNPEGDDVNMDHD